MSEATLHISVEKTAILTDFPSGSAMEFYEEHIYLMGDDARHILILDTNYQPVFNITMFEGGEKRIPKKEKSDIEASAIIIHHYQPHLLAIGSASKSQRERTYLFALPAIASSCFEIFDTGHFTDRLKDMAVAEVNIEGAATVGDHLLLSNRGNKTNPDNLLFVTTANFFEQQPTAPIHIIKVVLPQHEYPIGISALNYVAALDVLFFTASVELTANAYDDGGIGDSYLGYISRISTLVNSDTIHPIVLVNLTHADPVFIGQKVESICIEKIENDILTAHLVSDNDNGESTLFKVLIHL